MLIPETGENNSSFEGQGYNAAEMSCSESMHRNALRMTQGHFCSEAEQWGCHGAGQNEWFCLTRRTQNRRGTGRLCQRLGVGYAQAQLS